MAAAEVAAVVLAAGRSTRLGRNKLLQELHGRPLIHHAVAAALESRAAPVVVVLGHEAERVRSALDGLAVRCIEAADHAEGMAASLRAGIRAVPPEAAGALIALGDMPLLRPADYDRLIAARTPEALAVLPLCDGRRGHPVLLARALFPRVLTLKGDEGARRLLTERVLAERVVEVPGFDEAVLRDVDDEEGLRRLRGDPVGERAP